MIFATAQPSAARTAPDSEPLVVHNLLSDLDTLGVLLSAELDRESWLDAFLFAAGMAQITDDFLHPKVEPLDRAAAFLSGHRSPARRVAGRAIGATASALRAAAGTAPARRRSAGWARGVASLVESLADAVVVGSATDLGRARMLEAGGALTPDLHGLPEALRRSVLRVPACFHELDQRPEDLGRLVEEFSRRWPDRDRPLVSVGVRTSGSYLAPLIGAFLRALGYRRVSVLTIRPGRGFLRHERAQIRDIARGGGLALLTDDPPVSGNSIAASADELERAGLPRDTIVLLLQLLGTEAAPPPALESYEGVFLPSARWSVNEKLEPAAVEEALSGLLGPRTSVQAIEPLSARLPRSPRSHRRARFRVVLRDAETAEEIEKDVLAEGVGLGYLGAQELAAADVLDRFAPVVFGCEDGVIYREWLSDECRVGSVEPQAEDGIAKRIAAYATDRKRAMPVAEDVSPGLDDQPTWDVASSAISSAFGRAWPLAKVLLTDRAAKRLLRVDRPSVIDGNMDLGHWFFRNGSTDSLVKVDVGDQLFSNFGLRCFDPAFDLAGVTARETSTSFPRCLRRAYAEFGGGEIDEERWMLYELAHLWGWRRSRPDQEPELRRARSRVLQRYFADVFFADLPGSGSGPLCALDIDGVLETEHLGFPSLTPASALALRTLRAHGFRPVLVSGRSLDEVSERCRAYRLAGGIAEYGAALYETSVDRVEELAPSAAAGELRQLRARLERADGVETDPDFNRSVRAYRLERGQRVRLDAETTAQALAGFDWIRAVEGDGQTDFVAGSIDKGSGLQALVARLEPRASGPAVALAVGDTASDLPMAAEAARAFAPAHADRMLRNGGFELMRRPYQAGLAQAVGRLIGHAPGRCEVCRPPAATREREILLAALSVQERGMAGMPLRALKLAARTRRSAASTRKAASR